METMVIFIKQEVIKMKKLLKWMIGISLGIFFIPALYALGAVLFGTVVAFISNPKVMLIILGILAVLCFPGMVIVGFIKK